MNLHKTPWLNIRPGSRPSMDPGLRLEACDTSEQALEQGDWQSLQERCHARLLDLHQSQPDSLCTLRSLRWAITLLERLDASLPDSAAPVSEPVALLAGGPLKRKAAAHVTPAAPHVKRPRQEVHAVDSAGKAGSRTAERIQVRLALRDVSVLIKFVSHCLLLSLDQRPLTPGVDDDDNHSDNVESFENAPHFALAKHVPLDVSDSNKSMWLYRWLVKTLLWVPANTASDSDLNVAAMDWLVAYLTIADPAGVIRVVFEDLTCELLDMQSKGSGVLAAYRRRVSVFEFAALRMPEQLYFVLLPSLPCLSLNAGGVELSSMQKWKSGQSVPTSYISVWLALASISRCLLRAFVQLWVPPRDYQTGVIWCNWLLGCKEEASLFPKISEVFEGLDFEEQCVRTWLCALLKRRLAELAPVAADIVVLLYRSAQQHETQLVEDVGGLACELLEVILSQLARCLLSGCPGASFARNANHLAYASGAISCVDNLKENVNRLWDVLLELSPAGVCGSCAGARNEIFMLMDRRTLPLDRAITGDHKMYEGSQIGWPCLRAKFIFSQICSLGMVVCEENVIADLLVQGTGLTFHADGQIDVNSMERLSIIMNVTQFLVTHWAMQPAVKSWALKLCRLLQVVDEKQVLSIMATIRVLLSPTMWRKNTLVSGTFLGNLVFEEVEQSGIAWKSVWQLMRQLFHCGWPQYIALLNRDQAWEMKFSVLNVLRLLPSGEESEHGAALHLKCALKIFCHLLQELYAMFYAPDGKTAVNNGQLTCVNSRWHYVRVIEQLKKIIADHGALRPSSFTLMVNNLLDFSFSLCGREQRITGVASQDGDVSSTYVGADLLRFHHVHIPSQRQRGGRISTRIASELGILLRTTLERGILEASDKGRSHYWPSNPAAILAAIITTRMETPHEMPMTREQYEEILPKQVSSPRHVYLMECFNRNPFLFEILQLVFEHGEKQEALQCAELTRTLVADCIVQFHSAFRSQQPSVGFMKAEDMELSARTQLSRLIHLVSLSGWLPEALVNSKEIVPVVDGPCIADLLLLVWRCMHHGMTGGAKGWLGADTLESITGAHQSQVCTPEGGSMGVSAPRSLWESTFLSILRRNIIQLGPYVAHVTP